MKNQRQVITEFVQNSTQDEIIDTIQSLLSGTRVGIAGMKGENWLGTHKPSSKKAAIESALGYCEVVNTEQSKKIFKYL